MGAIYIKLNAEGRGRTGTVITDRRILKSCASANSATPAWAMVLHWQAEDGVRTRDPHLGKVVSTTELLPQIWF